MKAQGIFNFIEMATGKIVLVSSKHNIGWVIYNSVYNKTIWIS